MKCFASVWIGLCIATSAAPAPSSLPKSSIPATPTLRWNNGETITGEIAGGTRSTVSWKSPAFVEPLVLRWSTVRRIDQALPPAPSEEPFAVRARDGSVIHGDLVSATADAITLRSARHGEVILKRDALLSARRVHGPNLLFAGPAGDRGWTKVISEDPQSGNRPPASNTPAVPPLEEGPGGILAMPYWNSGAQLELTLPERVDAEFRITSTVQPDFFISFDVDAKQRIRIETWDDELVIVAGNNFRRLRKFDEKERVVAFRILWDRTTRQCAVYTPEGDLVTEWPVPEAELPQADSSAEKKAGASAATAARKRIAARNREVSVKPGVTVQGKGRDLALEYLRVRSWDGKQLTKSDPTKPRVEFGDGRTLVSDVSTIADGLVHLRSSAEAEQSFPLADVEAIVFAPVQPEAKERESKLEFADGTLLFGRPNSIVDGRILLETSFSEQPLAAALGGLRKMLVRIPAPDGTPAEPPLLNLDKLVMGEMTLHGTIAGSGGPVPNWQPVGSDTFVTPVKGQAAEITRAFPPGKVIEPAPALFYLASGDVIPGRLRGIDRSGAEIESNVVELKRVSGESLNAIQFGAATRAKFDGFLDPGWRIVKGTDETVVRTNESLHMEPETTIYHPSALFAKELKFSIKSKSFGCVRLRLFSDGAEAAKASSLVIMCMGTRVTAGIDDGEGQFESENQVGVRSGSAVKVKLMINDKDVVLTVNGYQMQKYPIDPSKRAGAGLIIEPSSMWGNSVQAIDLSDFSANSDLGKTWLPDVAAETKNRTLTVPRFRKDDAPRHALLAANGDVLRGEIEALTSNHFGFRSGLETIRVPRDRVKAAIWLKKADPDAPPPPNNNRVAERLAQRINGRSSYGGATLSILVDFLRRQDPELKFKLPAETEARSVEMSFGGQSIGDALEEICSLFNVSYQIDADGTIIIQPGAQVRNEILQRSYWLKTDAFKPATVREVLTAKGIPFASGSSVTWTPVSRVLNVINTPENHKKLADLLEAEFGGTAGSPTHWLSLTSGARFGLIIDKFDPDAVVGHHPVYGACRVPLSDINLIRTSIPEATEAMKSVADWRLVFAPEPVLPETPGESSPLLGQAAKGFKLPLLGGGEFDLASQQGKVVILDFWATWCGPCIKSLPGLIDAVSKLPADKVKLIGVNQGEPPDQVKQFIDTRRWALNVALDSSQTVGRDYGVDGIPFTVIVGPDGKVAWVHTGYTPEGEVEVSKVVQQLLDPQPPPP